MTNYNISLQNPKEANFVLMFSCLKNNDGQFTLCESSVKNNYLFTVIFNGIDDDDIEYIKEISKENHSSFIGWDDFKIVLLNRTIDSIECKRLNQIIYGDSVFILKQSLLDIIYDIYIEVVPSILEIIFKFHQSQK